MYRSLEDDEAVELLESTESPEAVDRQLKMEYHFQEILRSLGEDIDREGLRETPARVAKAWLEMTSGLKEDPRDHLKKVFTAPHDDMVIVDNIPFNSCCEHHMLPFVGVCHIGYIPGPVDENELSGPFRIAGLSKFPRLVQGYALRPQVQEILTTEVADAIDTVLKPQGVIVVMRAAHSCMSLRGVKATGSQTTTSAVRGLFATNHDGVKSEFLELLRSVRG